jgi:RimJ/RimL family protein N-acetyltransferase
MPWANDEPQPLAEKVELLRRFRGQFDLGHDFVYGIFGADEGEVVGGTGLHTRAGNDAFEIGYWIRASGIGRGLATETVAALTLVAFELCGVDRVEIKIDPANERSLAVPRRLGFAEEATLRRRLPARRGDEPRDVVLFTLFRSDLAGTPVAGARVEAYDAAAVRVL